MRNKILASTIKVIANVTVIVFLGRMADACYHKFHDSGDFNCIVPAHRGIRTGGLYNLVRHPLYASELFWMLGFVIANPSGWNIALWVCDCMLQFSRAYAEERFLGGDPIYSQYRARVKYRLCRSLSSRAWWTGCGCLQRRRDPNNLPESVAPPAPRHLPHSLGAPSQTDTMSVDTLPAEISSYPLAAQTREFFRQTRFGHVIGDDVADSPARATLPIREPASGLEFARVVAGDRTDVDRAVAVARSAYEDGRWRNLPPVERERRLRKLARLYEDHRELLSDLDVLEGGVLRGYSAFMVQLAIDIIDYYAGWPTKMHGTLPASSPNLVVQQVREPIGVVGVIMPWNGPSAVPLGVSGALACGNSVVLKPSEQTPLTAVLLARLALEADIPPGVFNVVQGVGEVVGAALVEHPQVDAICFTGSVETGRRIQASAAARLKRVALELGGKSPQLVFADADLDLAAATCAASVWGHSGQVCIAGTRVLVDRKIQDEFVQRMIAASKDLRIGSGFDPSSELGPLISQTQLDRVSGYVALGRKEGATLVLGGARHGSKGYFHQPTIFTGVHNNMRIAREEIFGPVMAVISFDTEDQALRIANDTEYGLAAGVWTRDLARAHRVSQRLDAGTVWVNTYLRVDPGVSYGGIKQSGFGRNLGMASMDELTRTKSVWFSVG